MSALTAGLTVSEDIAAAARALSETDAETAWLRAEVVDERVALVGLGTTCASVGSIAEDAHLDPASLAFLLVRHKGKFVLVSLVPDASPPRAKMLFSSSRDDVLRAVAALGPVALHLGSLDDLTAAAIESAGTRSDAPLSATEATLAEQDRLEQGVRQQSASASMSQLTFDLDPSARSALAAGAPWCALRLKLPEEVLTAGTALDAAGLDAEEPSFVVIRRDGAAGMLYHCPEAAPIRLAMTYSSALAPAQAAVSALLGVSVQRAESRALDEVGEAVEAMFAVAGAASASSAKAETQFAKPKGPPGRARGGNKRRVAKPFVADK